MNGSFFVFMAMLAASLFLGRAWCGWLCPAGGMQECLIRCNDKPAKQGWRNHIKYVIWVIWITLVIVTFILGKNKVTVDFFYQTDHGISVTEIHNYVVYYGVLMILVLPGLIHGRRGACHYLCWMAPFMIFGYKLGRLLRLPQVKIKSKPQTCAGCKSCQKVCPMALDVPALARRGEINSAECILCGECVAACKTGALQYKITNKRGAND